MYARQTYPLSMPLYVYYINYLGGGLPTNAKYNIYLHFRNTFHGLFKKNKNFWEYIHSSQLYMFGKNREKQEFNIWLGGTY